MKPAFPVVAVVIGGVLAACSADPKDEKLSREKLMDPQTCRECHAPHYDEWSGSMHAYAAEDPVFRAMNARGQEETDGELGSFCVGCHAPLAVREGLTTDGLNLDSVPESMRGITCYFCHDAEAVEGTHNNPIRLAGGRTMRGPIADPVDSPAHRSAYSRLLDGSDFASADLCGSCHDIVLPSPPAPAPVELERTFAEWKDTLFSPFHGDPDRGLTCNACHMAPRSAPAAEGRGLKVKQRTVHAHDFAGVDVALTPFPRMAEQRALVQEFLDTTLRADICVEQLGSVATLRVTLENLAAGHAWPSGAAQDRRAWVEVRAFDASGAELYASGVVPDGVAVTSVVDPDLWLFRDETFDEQGAPVHMFWEVASVKRSTIPGPITNDIRDIENFLRTHVVREFPLPSRGTFIDGIVDRVSVRVRMRPMGLDMLDDLIASGHLAPEVRDEMPTFDLIPGRHLEDQPGLANATFEWSEATHDDPRFDVYFDSQVGRRFCCIGMPSNRPGVSNQRQPCR